MNQPTLGEIMTADVRTLQEDQPVLDALQFLYQNHVRHVPVMKGDALVGVITDRDVKRATPSALVPSQREVYEKVVKGTQLTKIMTRDPTTASPGTLLQDGLRLFVEERIGCLPILEDGKLVGIVTGSDLFKAMLELLES